MILGGTKIRSDAKRADKLPLGLVQAGTAGYREKRNGMVRGMCRLKRFPPSLSPFFPFIAKQDIHLGIE